MPEDGPRVFVAIADDASLSGPRCDCDDALVARQRGRLEVFAVQGRGTYPLGFQLGPCLLACSDFAWLYPLPPHIRQTPLSGWPDVLADAPGNAAWLSLHGAARGGTGAGPAGTGRRASPRLDLTGLIFVCATAEARGRGRAAGAVLVAAGCGWGEVVGPVSGAGVKVGPGRGAAGPVVGLGQEDFAVCRRKCAVTNGTKTANSAVFPLFHNLGPLPVFSRVLRLIAPLGRALLPDHPVFAPPDQRRGGARKARGRVRGDVGRPRGRSLTARGAAAAGWVAKEPHPGAGIAALPFGCGRGFYW